MPFLYIAGAALVGFVLGYFFTTPLLVIITICGIIISIVMRPKREQGLAGVIGYLTWIFFGCGFAALWITHLYVIDVNIGIPDISQYIFRQ